MCGIIEKPELGVHGQGYFRKDNWPPGQALVWDVVAHQCKCGEWWVRKEDDKEYRLHAARMVNDIV